jgi:hypothetical protein
MKNIFKGIMLAFIFLMASFSESSDLQTNEGQVCLTSFFSSSLHYTGEGMRHWYEDDDGYRQVIKVPYNQLDCKNCHVTSCDSCHVDKKERKPGFSVENARDMETCLSCHSRESLTFKIDSEKDQLDVHIGAGMVCADCHYRYDVHGDGRYRPSMRHPNAVRASCRACHVEQERESPEFDPDTESHSVHGVKLDCAACHVSNTVSCYNCHFENFLKTGKRKGNFVPMKNWMLLINYNGKVTSGNLQTLVYKNKKFVAYAPYFTHSVTSEGKECNDCHRNKAVVKIERGEKVRLVDFKGSQIIPWEGVVPVIEGKLDLIFLNIAERGWEPLSSGEDPLVQYVAYGSPLNKKQFQKLVESVSK